eukprot:1543957-Pyramimonas_sp.AAC.1
MICEGGRGKEGSASRGPDLTTGMSSSEDIRVHHGVRLVLLLGSSWSVLEARVLCRGPCWGSSRLEECARRVL